MESNKGFFRGSYVLERGGKTTNNHIQRLNGITLIYLPMTSERSPMTSEEAVIKNRASVAGMPSSGSDGSEKELRFRSFLVVAIDQWLANRTLIAEG